MISIYANVCNTPLLSVLDLKIQYTHTHTHTYLNDAIEPTMSIP